jgi:hypothetical protein
MATIATEPEIDLADRDARYVRRSWHTFVAALVLAGIGVLPWLAYCFVPPPGVKGDMARLSWAWLFYISGVPLLLISGVFYVTSLVYGFAVVQRRPVVWTWVVLSLVVLTAWCVFALNVLAEV